MNERVNIETDRMNGSVTNGHLPHAWVRASKAPSGVSTYSIWFQRKQRIRVEPGSEPNGITLIAYEWTLVISITTAVSSGLLVTQRIETLLTQHVGNWVV